MSGTYNLRAAGLRQFTSPNYVNTLLGLQNAKFRVTNTSAYNTVTGFTNASGNVALTGLTNSTYTAVEEVAPPNYSTIPSMWTGSVSGGTTEVSYNDVQTINNDNKTRTSRQMVFFHENNAYPECGGLRIALVMDLSASIDSTELAQMKAACVAFVNAMVETGDAIMPTQIALITFETTASLVLNWITITGTVNPGGATTVNNAINALQTGTYTNWDAAFRLVAVLNPLADVVVFLTDGNPTAYNVSPVVSGTNITFDTIGNAVASANVVKSINSRMTKIIGVGIGNDLTIGNIKLISGPNLDDDYFTANSFNSLILTLNQIAIKLCGNPICLKAGTPIDLLNGQTIAIESVLPNSTMLDYRGCPIEVLSVIRTGRTKQFILISPDSLGDNLPKKEVHIIAGHPILIDGREVCPENLCNGNSIRMVNLDQGEDIYTLCTEKRTFVNVQGLQVGTWGRDAWDNFLLNDSVGRQISAWM